MVNPLKSPALLQKQHCPFYFLFVFLVGTLKTSLSVIKKKIHTHTHHALAVPPGLCFTPLLQYLMPTLASLLKVFHCLSISLMMPFTRKPTVTRYQFQVTTTSQKRAAHSGGVLQCAKIMPHLCQCDHSGNPLVSEEHFFLTLSMHSHLLRLKIIK